MTTDYAVPRERCKVFMAYGHEKPQRKCPTCGVRFFTGVGLDEHVRLTHPTVVPEPLPCGLDAREHGLRLAARNNARRRRCSVCGLESTPGPMVLHQSGSGHLGWTEA